MRMDGLELESKGIKKLAELFLLLGDQAHVGHHYQSLPTWLLNQVFKHYQLGDKGLACTSRCRVYKIF